MVAISIVRSLLCAALDQHTNQVAVGTHIWVIVDEPLQYVVYIVIHIFRCGAWPGVYQDRVVAVSVASRARRIVLRLHITSGLIEIQNDVRNSLAPSREVILGR